jgi:very-short-patch-repair endonuclease
VSRALLGKLNLPAFIVLVALNNTPSPLMGEGWGEGELPHKNIQFAKVLRTSQTDAELKIWQALRAGRLTNYKFKRQVPIANFIVDFVCFEHKLIVEIDGGQHMRNSEDVLRDAKLIKMSFRVLRFWNNDVMQNLEGVLMTILQYLQAVTPLPNPLPQGERGL